MCNVERPIRIIIRATTTKQKNYYKIYYTNSDTETLGEQPKLGCRFMNIVLEKCSKEFITTINGVFDTL